MARPLRLEFEGACYHVINRGNYRRNIFEPEGAAKAFKECLFLACEKFGWRLHAFVLMRNHYHLALETPQPNLSEGMKWLQGTWAVRFNRFRGEKGRPFQGRFKALHVEPGHALAQVAHYIHLNPVRAKVVTADRLTDFEWSSLRSFTSKARPDFLCAATLLEESGGLADTPSGWRRYIGYLGLLAEEDVRTRAERMGSLSRGWAIGTREFRASLREEMKDRGAQPDRTELLGAQSAQLRRESWEDSLPLAAKALKVDLKALGARKSSPEKVKLAALMRAKTSVSNGWLAERLQMGEAASVSQFARRFRLSGGEGKVEFKRALSRFNV